MAMDNIDLVLKKHFQKESSPEEEKLIERFKQENFHEYNVYKHLWNSNTIVTIREYDTNAAWLKVTQAKNQKIIPFYRNFRKIAAVAALLLWGMASAYLVYHAFYHREILTVAEQSQRGKEIVLKDGSRIWLNRNAQLTYPAKFNDNERKVSLDGEAYFDIARDPDKPFIINTNHSEITVLGTSFNINTNSENSKISVTTGQVNVKSVYSGESIVLMPEYAATVSKEAIQKSAINNLNYMSWKTGKFVFNEAPLEEVVHALNSFYNKQIVIKSNKNACKFSAGFNQDNLSDIIEVLSLSCNLKIINKQNIYEIH
jgi:ferric-dicitrate binding protein FerR (iron transport regulator)